MHKRYRLMSQRQLHLHNGFVAWKGEAGMSLLTSPDPARMGQQGRPGREIIYTYMHTKIYLSQHLK